MKKSELKQIIREEIQKIINESEIPTVTDVKLPELIKAIQALPDTIKSLSVPIEVKIDNPRSKSLSPKTATWKEDAIKLIKNAIRTSAVDRGPFTFNLRSFTQSTPTASYYIQIESPSSKKFAKSMASGKYGSLD